MTYGDILQHNSTTVSDLTSVNDEVDDDCNDDDGGINADNIS